MSALRRSSPPPLSALAFAAPAFAPRRTTPSRSPLRSPSRPVYIALNAIWDCNGDHAGPRRSRRQRAFVPQIVRDRTAAHRLVRRPRRRAERDEVAPLNGDSQTLQGGQRLSLLNPNESRRPQAGGFSYPAAQILFPRGFAARRKVERVDGRIVGDAQPRTSPCGSIDNAVRQWREAPAAAGGRARQPRGSLPHVRLPLRREIVRERTRNDRPMLSSE